MKSAEQRGSWHCHCVPLIGANVSSWKEPSPPDIAEPDYEGEMNERPAELARLEIITRHAVWTTKNQPVACVRKPRG